MVYKVEYNLLEFVINSFDGRFKVLLVLGLASADNDDKYSPCSYKKGRIHCSRKPDKVLNAFRKNGKKQDIKKLFIGHMDDMTDDKLGEIFSIVASTAGNTVQAIELTDMKRITKIPEPISRLTNLQSLFINWMPGLKTLNKFSLSFATSPKIIDITNVTLKTIKHGAFKGNLTVDIT